MPNIKYVCISDTHFGADNSVLTNLGSANDRVDPSQPSPVLIQLVECLRAIISQNAGTARPTLILNGDILDLALSPENVAAMAFQRFLELVMPEDRAKRLFESKIFYIPGNHDHHLWETARETQYANLLERIGRDKPPPPPWHTTKMVDKGGVRAEFVNVLIDQYPRLKEDKVHAATVYPNLAVSNEAGTRLAIFSHGHFTEDLYLLMTTLADLIFPNRRRTSSIYDLEAENFAWIDFFWSTMGRSGGGVGGEVELIYDSMQDPKKFAGIVARLGQSVVRKYGTGFWRSPVVGWLLGFVLKRLIGGNPERSKPEQLLSDDGKGLRAYLQGPVSSQLTTELKGRPMPQEAAFVFGHTHKPFEERTPLSAFPQNHLPVYNSGGWVVDRPKPQKRYGGAVILLDENLDAASLRMYNEAEGSGSYKVGLRTAWPPASSPTPFFQRLAELIRPDEQPWKGFSAAAAEAVRRHNRKLGRELGKS